MLKILPSRAGRRVQHAVKIERFEGRCKQLIDGRCAYNKIQQEKTPKSNLTQDQIERLKDIGFKWKVGYLLATEAHVPRQYSSES